MSRSNCPQSAKNIFEKIKILPSWGYEQIDEKWEQQREI